MLYCSKERITVDIYFLHNFKNCFLRILYIFSLERSPVKKKINKLVFTFPIKLLFEVMQTINKKALLMKFETSFLVIILRKTAFMFNTNNFR